MYEPYCTYFCTSSNPTDDFIYEHEQPIDIGRSSDNNHCLNKSIRRSKHIPHHLRPRHIVERRNTRERRRVQDVNQAFYMLRALLPIDGNDDQTESSHSTRLSKVRTLRKAVEYILALQHLLNEHV
jgi:hypothetical protein